MRLLSILLIVISAVIVLLAIIFEGKLKNSSGEKLTVISFIREIKLVSPFGWILIALMLLLNFGNNLISYQEKIEQKDQFVQDTIRYSNIITTLEDKRVQDSIIIEELKKEVRNTGLKSDLIRKEVVETAVKELNEQRKLLDRKKENAYIQMISEVEDNLRKIYINFREDHIRGFIDTTYFISTRLKNEKLHDYIDLSSRFAIINYLMEAAESIDAVNKYADSALQSKGGSDSRKMDINMFLKNVDISKRYMLNIYKRTYGLQSYKQYESLDFSEEVPNINDSLIQLHLSIDYIQKISDTRIEFK